MAHFTIEEYGDFTDAHKTERMEYIQHIHREYENLNLQDLPLWLQFKLDFEGWTMEHFKHSHLGKQCRSLGALRFFMKTRGVWVDMKKSIPTAMIELLLEDQQVEWTLEMVLNMKDNFDSPDMEYILKKNNVDAMGNPRNASTRSSARSTLAALPA